MAGKNKNKSLVLRFVVLAVCGYMIVSLCSLWGELVDSLAEKQVLIEQRDEKQAQISELKTLLYDGTEEQIVEKAARERLGYVYANEQVFIDISGN
jgi:cell division protein FtsB